MFGAYRTILAVMVVFSHLSGFAGMGEYAVFGFYVLSGYLMTMIMHQTYGFTFQGFCIYATNRFLRIFPLYWASICFSITLIYFVGAEYVSEYHKSMYLPVQLADIMKNILIFFPFRENPRLTPPSWALTVECFFYLVIGLGLSRHRALTIVWFIASVSYHAVAVAANCGIEYIYYPISAASLPFSIGALLFHYRTQIEFWLDYFTPKYFIWLPLAVFFLVLLNWRVSHSRFFNPYVHFYINLFLLTLMTSILAKTRSLPYNSKKQDDWWGSLSYPVYLLHYQVGLLIIILLSFFGIEITRPHRFLAILSLPGILFCSWLLAVLLEIPIAIIREKLKSANSRSQTKPAVTK